MKTPSSCFRSWKRYLCTSALAGAFFSGSSTLQAGQYYATPTGAGALNGSSWANAYPQGQIQTAINAMVAGDTLNIGSGTYTITALSISGSGTSSNFRNILGVDTGSGLPLFDGGFDVANSATTRFISFPAGASYWSVKNLRFQNQPWVIDMPLSGTTYTLRTNITFENLAFDTIEDAIRIRNASNITVRACSAIRHTKKAFRIGRYSSYVTFEKCSADANGGDDSFPTRSIPNGFAGDDTNDLPDIHDLTFIDCTARNNRFSQSSGSYWNGDGFATEEATYNVSYIRCKSFNNHDGGFDDKASNVLYQDCIAVGNKRGFRYWGPSGEMFNCLSAYNASWGGSGGANGIWVSGGGGNIAIDFSTFHNNASTQIYGETGATISVDKSIISTASSTTSFASSLVTMTSTATYRPGAGTDPSYVADSSAWRGSPANALDSQTYGTTKGYSSTQVSYPANTPPTVTIGASPTGGTLPLPVNFTATAGDPDGVVAAYNWDFGNGTTSTSQNPSVTYANAGNYSAQCTVTDNLGATTTASTTITVVSPTYPTIARIEAGSSTSFTDSSSNLWSPDHSFGSGGGTVDRGAIAIGNTVDDRIYQTERWGVSTYAIPVANGAYTVILHFAETYSGITAAGQRVFTVTAEGTTPAGWSNIDVFAESGGSNMALKKSAAVTVSDGVLNLGFTASVNNTMISGIEILPASNTIATVAGPTSVNAGTAYTVNVSYSAADSRRVYVEFRSPGNSILASSYVYVSAGSGTTGVTVTVPGSTASGSGYRWTAKLKGSSGSPEYARKDQLNVTVN